MIDSPCRGQRRSRGSLPPPHLTRDVYYRSHVTRMRTERESRWRLERATWAERKRWWATDPLCKSKTVTKNCWICGCDWLRSISEAAWHYVLSSQPPFLEEKRPMSEKTSILPSATQARTSHCHCVKPQSIRNFIGQYRVEWKSGLSVTFTHHEEGSGVHG